jgi:hypothetical protein
MLSVEILTFRGDLVLDVHNFNKITSKDVDFQVEVDESRKTSLLFRIQRLLRPVFFVANAIDNFVQRYVPRNEPKQRKYSMLPTTEAVKIHVQRYELQNPKCRKSEKKKSEGMIHESVEGENVSSNAIVVSPVVANTIVVNVQTKYPVSVWSMVFF